MKRKDIKNLIKSQYQVPDIKHKIDISRIAIEPGDISIPKKIFNFKKLSLELASFMLIIALAVTSYVGISLLFNTGDITPPIVERKTLSSDKVDTLGVVSTSVLYDGVTTSNNLNLASPFLDASPSLFSTYIDQMNQYVQMIELFAEGTNDVTLNVQPDSNVLPGYDHYVIYEVKDLLGDVLSYHYHYQDTHIYDQSVKTNLLIIDSINYYIEISNDLMDSETSYIVYKDSQTRLLDYLKMTVLVDDQGQYFQYETYKDGILQNTLIMKLFTDQDENIHLETLFNDHLSDLKFKFDLKKDSNQKNLNGTYEIINNQKEEFGEVKITISRNPLQDQNEYRYHYKNTHNQKGMEKGRRNHHSNNQDETLIYSL